MWSHKKHNVLVVKYLNPLGNLCYDWAMQNPSFQFPSDKGTIFRVRRCTLEVFMQKLYVDSLLVQSGISFHHFLYVGIEGTTVVFLKYAANITVAESSAPTKKISEEYWFETFLVMKQLPMHIFSDACLRELHGLAKEQPRLASSLKYRLREIAEETARRKSFEILKQNTLDTKLRDEDFINARLKQLYEQELSQYPLYDIGHW